jgi:nucleoside-diphosphate-sugar epimerase
MKNNVLVIGGSGFVGSRFISDCQNYYAISNLDKNQSPFHPKITTIADVPDIEALSRTINKNIDAVVLLAAEHRDDVHPVELYYDVNVKGTKNVLKAMDKQGVSKIIFTSSVAIYGLDRDSPNEDSDAAPFNNYGKSKWVAEGVLNDWVNKDPENRCLTIIRPTVIFGERNRGNVYNLLKQINSSRFVMIGKGENKKSMAYVGNISAFIKYCIDTLKPGKQVFNYVDYPDLTMNQLMNLVYESMDKKPFSFHLPKWFGILGGYGFDILKSFTGKKYPISSVRVKKFCATTQFNAYRAHSSGFKAPFELNDALDRTIKFEFANKNKQDQVVFYSE